MLILAATLEHAYLAHFLLFASWDAEFADFEKIKYFACVSDWFTVLSIVRGDTANVCVVVYL